MFFKNLCRFHSGSGSSLNAVCCLTRGCSALRASGVHLHSTSTSKPATQTRNEGLENGCCQVRWMLHLAATLLMPCVNTRPMTPLCGRRKRDSIPSYHKKRRLLVVFFIASFSAFIQLAIINAVLPGVPDSTCAYAKMLKILRCVKRSSDFTVALIKDSGSSSSSSSSCRKRKSPPKDSKDEKPKDSKDKKDKKDKKSKKDKKDKSKKAGG